MLLDAKIKQNLQNLILIKRRKKCPCVILPELWPWKVSLSGGPWLLAQVWGNLYLNTLDSNERLMRMLQRGGFLYWMTDRQTAELPVKQCRPWWAGYIVQVGRTGENWRLQLGPAAGGPGPFSLSRSHFGWKLTRMAGAQWYKLQEIIELDKIYRK